MSNPLREGGSTLLDKHIQARRCGESSCTCTRYRCNSANRQFSYRSPTSSEVISIQLSFGAYSDHTGESSNCDSIHPGELSTEDWIILEAWYFLQTRLGDEVTEFRRASDRARITLDEEVKLGGLR